MNPSGDFGKKELSNALRNRLTEIWVPSLDYSSPDYIELITEHFDSENLTRFECSSLANMISNAISWCHLEVPSSVLPLSTRDVLSWVELINNFLINKSHEPTAGSGEGLLSPSLVLYYLHGGHMILVDSIVGNSYIKEKIKQKLQAIVSSQLSSEVQIPIWSDVFSSVEKMTLILSTGKIGDTFRLPKDYLQPRKLPELFDFSAPSTSENFGKMIRALSVKGKAILLEGPPGTGKSQIVSALAEVCGQPLVRINLSDQTELLDLLGQDMPNSSAEGGGLFSWVDGPLLKAVRAGHWVLLDELNLAPQAVVEGLNALLDHRKEVYLSAELSSAPRLSGFLQLKTP
jgi:midasin